MHQSHRGWILGLEKHTWFPGEVCSEHGTFCPPSPQALGFLLGSPLLWAAGAATLLMHLWRASGGAATPPPPDPAVQPNSSGGRSWPWWQGGKEGGERRGLWGNPHGWVSAGAVMSWRMERLHRQAGTLHGRIWGTSQGDSLKQGKRKLVKLFLISLFLCFLTQCSSLQREKGNGSHSAPGSGLLCSPDPPGKRPGAAGRAGRAGREAMPPEQTGPGVRGRGAHLRNEQSRGGAERGGPSRGLGGLSDRWGALLLGGLQPDRGRPDVGREYHGRRGLSPALRGVSSVPGGGRWEGPPRPLPVGGGRGGRAIMPLMPGGGARQYRAPEPGARSALPCPAPLPP